MSRESDRRNDYMSRKKLEKRLLEAKRGGSRVYRQLIIPIPHPRTLDAFVREVAHAIREYVVYRTDGGNFARGLVRHSRDLTRMWNWTQSDEQKETETHEIRVHLLRRRAPKHSDRWVLELQMFKPAVREIIFEKKEGNVIQPNLRDVKERAEAVIDHILQKIDAPEVLGKAAQVYGKGKDKKINKERARAYFVLADHVGWPKFKTLWCYHQDAVENFCKATIEDRNKWLQGKKKFPLEGLTGTMGHGPAPDQPWRLYPFAMLMEFSKNFYPEQMAGSWAFQVDAWVNDSLWAFDFPGFKSGNQSTMEEQYALLAFRDHLQDLFETEDVNCLYYLWNKHTEIDPLTKFISKF